MEIWFTLLFVLVIFSLGLVAWTVTTTQKTTLSLSDRSTRLVEAVLEADDARARLLDKAIVLLSTKDPLAFQGVQAMNQHGPYDERYDPSDEAELKRLGEAIKEGDISVDDSDEATREQEREFLHSIGVPVNDL